MQTLAFFAAADDQYVPTAVMALRSFQRWYPESGYFLLGTRAAMSQESLDFLRHFGIELLDVNEAHRFVTQGARRDAYPPECFYIFRGPELIAERGFEYSVSVDGDVFCARPLELEAVLGRIEGLAGRPVGTLGRTLEWRKRGGNADDPFIFTFDRVRDTLGLHEGQLKTRYEVNTGVVIWNNVSMAKLGLFNRATEVFGKCQGCFESDQDLLALTSAVHDISFLELGDPFNFNFFEDSLTDDKQLREQVRRGEFDHIYIVHYVWSKPWRSAGYPSAAGVHFVNAWREFVLNELGVKAYDLFDDLSIIRFNRLAHMFWRLERRIWSEWDWHARPLIKRIRHAAGRV